MRAFEHARATKGILQKLQNTACHIRVENPENDGRTIGVHIDDPLSRAFFLICQFI
ncbi:hypothetical protein HO173_002444 [Letharia columbiana]|uniref:Uncharacterized protein n=1 Tax=Letharia columbiana TaxID=112416 RepID=A0A8H6L884_9LECA|nr:uncharacterized protein HO173_002444 [Letharia columbiana]KAF6239183.1 hypothetical protein HO173_002444 [Letharia columbiana]